ncbi:glycosyltransferase family 2 protein [Thermoproteota archaeon]
MKKILIGIPTYWKEEHCLKEFIEGLGKLTYEADILIVDNTDNDFYFDKLKTLKMKDRKLTILKDQYSDTRISRIISSRNMIRDHFLKSKYDYLFSLDSDILPPPDAIQKLIRADSDIASGVYLCRQVIEGQHHIQPVIYRPNDDGSVITVTKDEVTPNKLMAIAVCGMGCCLIKKEVMEKIEFRPFSQSKTGGEDVAFCTDARKNGFKIVANTEVKCDHMGEHQTWRF